MVRMMSHPNDVGRIEITPEKIRVVLSDDFWEEAIDTEGDSLFDYRVEFLCAALKASIHTAATRFQIRH